MGAPVFRFEEVVLAQLARDDRETYELDDGGELADSLSVILDAPDAWPEVRRALELCVALEARLGSPSAAARIKDVLRSDPRAVALIQKHLIAVRGVDELRGFLEQQGREVVLRAPSFSAEPPPHTVRLETLRPQTKGWIR